MNRITIATIALVGLAASTAWAASAAGRPYGRGPGNSRGASVAVCDGNGPGQGAGFGRMRGQGPGRGRNAEKSIAQNDTPLSDEEKQGVLSMREEEKLARDVYAAMYELWQVQAYRNISSAEQRHMDALGRAIQRYELDDPVTDDTAGVFADPEFGVLYDELIAKGSVSLLDGLKVGALIEEMDIADLRSEIENTDRPDLRRVYENLLRGSRNHLRAFAAQIKAAGGTYEAQYLPQVDFDQIAASPTERGNGRKAGRGGGKGTGQHRANRRGDRHGNGARTGRSGRGPVGRN